MGGGDRLLGRLERPPEPEAAARGLVLLLPGLGGDSEGHGPRRLARALTAAGWAVLRLNLRGAGDGRSLATGLYAARCDRDLLPVIAACQKLARQLGGSRAPLPLVGVGLSLGGTILLNLTHGRPLEPPALAAVAALSSPLDLAAACRRIGHPRNALYQHWMLRRLERQALADPHGLTAEEQARRRDHGRRLRSLRDFDAWLTAPRWGWDSVDAYYAGASPLPWLEAGGVAMPTLLLHAEDDPWVPVDAHRRLAARRRLDQRLQVLLTPGGGHNGFHDRQGCWSDRAVVTWLGQQLGPGAF